MTSFLSKVLSCWSFSSPPEWSQVPSEEKPRRIEAPRSETVTQNNSKITFEQQLQQKEKESTSSYTSPVEWNSNWEDEEEESTPINTAGLEDDLPTLPTVAIKATIISAPQKNDTKKEEVEEEEDFFSDMEPQVVPTQKIVVAPTLDSRAPASTRIKLALAPEEDIVVII